MSRKTIINRTVNMLDQLPEDKLQQAVDYIQYLLWKYEQETLIKGVSKLNIESESFRFLEEEEDLYTVEDLKERYDNE